MGFGRFRQFSQRRFLMVLLLPLLPLASARAQEKPAQEESAKTCALLVGVGLYDTDALASMPFADLDASAIATAFEGLHFTQVQTLTSVTTSPLLRPTNTKLLKALDRAAKDADGAETFVFYFGGHTFRKDGQDFLGTVNADPDSVETLSLSALPLTMLQERLLRIRARQFVVILNADQSADAANMAEFAKRFGDALQARGHARQYFAHAQRANGSWMIRRNSRVFSRRTCWTR